MICAGVSGRCSGPLFEIGSGRCARWMCRPCVADMFGLAEARKICGESPPPEVKPREEFFEPPEVKFVITSFKKGE
jgi:hypothetical protein